MKTKTIYRSSITGKIVSKKYALENPDTTQRETLLNPKIDLRKELANFGLYILPSDMKHLITSELIDDYLSK